LTLPSITVQLPEEEVRERWTSIVDKPASFKPAPGDRGTEIHVPRGNNPVSRAQAKDELRRFKQLVETGEISRSDAIPEGERFARKLHRRSAQPVAS
jgi:hypothetical protein